MANDSRQAQGQGGGTTGMDPQPVMKWSRFFRSADETTAAMVAAAERLDALRAELVEARSDINPDDNLNFGRKMDKLSEARRALLESVARFYSL